MTRVEQRQESESKIAAYRASGQTAKEWCAANDVQSHQLWYMLRRNSAGKTSPVTPTRWLSVAMSRPDSGKHNDTLLIRIGEASIEVRPGFDPDLFSGVVRVL